jgi:hypothetical protein
MEELLQSNDPRLLLMLIGCAFVILLAWIMDGIASTQSAENGEPQEPPARAAPPEHAAPPRYDTPDRCEAPIGRYMDSTIFDTVSIGGIEYRFDHVLAPGARWLSEHGERCIAPGLVYVTR